MKHWIGVTLVALSVAAAAHAATFEQKDKATLRALDKITGRSTDIDVNVGEPIVYGSLNVELQSCYQTPPEEAPESAAFLKITSTQPVAEETMEAAAAEESDAASEDTPTLFSGWMYASSPGLSALEHPVYDIWVIRCTTPTPVKFESPVIPDNDEPIEDETPPGFEVVDNPDEIEEAIETPRDPQ